MYILLPFLLLLDNKSMHAMPAQLLQETVHDFSSKGLSKHPAQYHRQKLEHQQL